MRVLHLRSTLLARRSGAATSRSSVATAATRALQLRTPIAASNALPLHLRRRTGARTFSASSKFPTQDESAILAHADDDHDANVSQLVCGSCNTPISETKDLIFFKWKNGIHLSSTTDAPLRHLHSQDHWNDAVHWKKHKLNCLKCGNSVGTIAKVFATDKLLFSAKHVAIEMPAHQSPLISISGYPSSQLGFSYWTELILMLESQPSLKDALQIRRIDHIQDVNGERKLLNRKLLLAKDLRALLHVVDEHSAEMNAVNISTALDRASRFIANQTTSRVSVTPRLTFSTKSSEAPEDELLDIASHLMARPRSAEEIAIEKKRFWDLIQSAENLVNFSIAPMRGGYELANFVSSLMRLGIGRKSILEPIAKQTLFVIRADAEPPAVNAHEVSVIAAAIVHLSAKDERSEPWVTELLLAAADVAVRESATAKPCGPSTLVPLVRALVIADVFHAELFALLFRDVVAHKRLDQALTLAAHKANMLKAKMYQVHLDCELQNRDSALRLAPAQVREYKALFAGQEAQSKSASFRLQHLVSTALVEMRLAHDQAVAVGSGGGYAVDIALPKHKIAIEINASECYQVVPTETESESETQRTGDSDDMVPPIDKLFGFVDLKARHLETLGWVVIQLRADTFQELATVEDRARHLSMLLEVATNARRQQQSQ